MTTLSKRHLNLLKHAVNMLEYESPQTLGPVVDIEPWAAHDACENCAYYHPGGAVECDSCWDLNTADIDHHLALLAETVNLLEETKTMPKPNLQTFFTGNQKHAVTFVGYSSMYDDQDALYRYLNEVLAEYDTRSTLVAAGATVGGIGLVYNVAKTLGFETVGIVSSIAKNNFDVSVSTACDHVFYVEDETWGGTDKYSGDLTPTSQARVDYSDEIVAYGGGTIATAETLAAVTAGKPVAFTPAKRYTR